MTNKWKVTTSVNLVIALCIIAGTALLVHSQRQDNQSKKSQIDKQTKDVPIADYNESLPNNVEERAKREKKNKARNLKNESPNDARRFALTEERESNYGLVSSHLRAQPAIPAKQSDAIIIGEVVSARAHLSEDKVSIYSEFEISNPQILKNTAPKSFSPEKPIMVSREGGGVRFPSGKVTYRFVLGIPMPRMGSKYLFFLKYSPETEFSIITAYELAQGQVLPLDGVMPNGSVISQYTGHQSFKGVSEADFVNQVKESVEKNLDIFTRGQ